MSIKQSHSFSLGIVGLPNVGKSSIFNALTEMSVPAENFPFCTIDKNVGIVEILDKRLKRMAEHFKAEKIVPSVMKFVDIAGLVKGASKGEGLGNQFLSHIREVDVIMYVLRAFESEKIVHVYNRVNPIEDLEIVQSELILKDIETVEKRLNSVEKTSRIGDEESKQQYEVLKRVMENLDQGIPVVEMGLLEDEKKVVDDLFLLTSKKRLFILNSRAGIDMDRVDDWRKTIQEKTGDTVLVLDIKFLQDMTGMSSAEKEEYIEMLEQKPLTIDDVIQAAFKCLNLISFYTGSQKECNSWSIERGSTVKEAAGVIHTDLEKGFITADVVNIDLMLKAGGWVNAKEKGLVKNHGREYIVQDGDYVIILSNN